MHTVMRVGIGVIALAVFAVGGALSGRSAAWGARWFLLPWLVVALINFYIGTTRGYSAMTELGFFLIVFGLPAIAAWGIIRLYGR
jgi:hypothetical protein